MTAKSRAWRRWEIASWRWPIAKIVTTDMTASAASAMPATTRAWRRRRSASRRADSATRCAYQRVRPLEHRIGKHVVEDLVATVDSVAVDPARAQDAELRQAVEDGLKLLGRAVRELGEVAHPVRDLRSRWCHEMVEHPRRCLFLRLVQRL